MKNLSALLTRKNISNALFILLILVLLVSPQAKALLIRGMMAAGVMRPPTETDTEVTRSTPAVNISLLQQNGMPLQTGQLKGKVLLINFWATWCPPCIAEMPSINQLHLRYKNGGKLVVIPVDADNDLARSTGFINDNGYDLPVYRLGGKLPAGLISNALPTTLIIDKSGRVVARHEGAADYSTDAFYKYLDKLIEE